MILRAAPTSTALNSLLHRQRRQAIARAKIMVTLVCEHCGDAFRLQQGHYDSRTRAAGHAPKYCSRFCMGAANRVPENTPPPDGNLELWDTSQPPGQRVEDKLAFSKAFLLKYGETVSAVTMSDAISGMAGLL